MNTIGILAGLVTAVCWTATSTCFEQAGRRIGSLSVNIVRLAFALILFLVLSFARTGAPVQPGVSGESWFFLSLSGAIGFVLGDLMLFRAFVLIGSRLSMLIYASVPLITATIGFLALGETMRPLSIAGMVLTVFGIALAVMGKRGAAEAPAADGAARKRLGRRGLGIVLAFGGSVGQAVGLILGKRGSVGLDSFAATEIRAITGLAGFLVIALLGRKFSELARPFAAAFRRGNAAAPATPAAPGALSRREARVALGFTLVGATLGPFLGVSLGLLSAQLTTAGVASTLMSIVPVIIIPVAVLVFKEKVSAAEVFGAVLAVSGVVVLAF
jgi:drug/metabolite transporter (DMT)-like permease